MSSLSQSSFLCSLHTTKTMQRPTKNTTFFHPTNPKFITCKPIKISAFSVKNSQDESFLPLSSSNGSEQSLEESKPEGVKFALERAKEYRKTLNLDENQEISNNPVDEIAGIVSEDSEKKEAGEYQQNKGIVGNGKSNGENENLALQGVDDGGEKAIPEAVRRAMEKAKEYQKNKGFVGNNRSNVESENLQGYRDGGREVVPEGVKKAKEYNKGDMGDNKSNEETEQLIGDVRGEDMEVPEAVRVAMEKAKEYKKNKGIMDDGSSIVDKSKLIGSKGGSSSNLGNGNTGQNTEKKGDFRISNIDFVGLNFADKKQGRGLPAGLVPIADPFLDDDLPEVEILVGDASNFENAAPSESTMSSEEESSDLYKPKVATWGMFPRPNNISKTFGGGRNIRPGESLESAEDRAAKEARTRQLIAAYKRKTGLNIDPNLKAECEKALKDGESLMDVGRLKEALPYYQTVMDKLAFQTELHGLAALQWSICQDSLSRPEKARAMYEKLQSHPNAEVSKKARQFTFSFQAMEIMKVTKSNAPTKSTGYQSYFEAFVEDKANYGSQSTKEKEDALNQSVLYIVFLASPILLVLLFVVLKRV